MPRQLHIEEVLKQIDSHHNLLGDEVVQTIHEIVEQYQKTINVYISKQAQRKHITVLFADISGFTALSETMDAEDVTSIINALWQKLDLEIITYGGHIDKHIGDAVMALWGVDQAQEDDAGRAVRAGLAMQKAIQQFVQSNSDAPLKLRIGIHSGPAILAHVGTTAEFTAMGDTVNTASRLENAAPVDGVLISHDTYQLIRGLFECEEQKKLSVKGKIEPLRTYRVCHARVHASGISSRGIEGVKARMIGREVEFKEAQIACNKAIYQQYPGLISLTGDAGIGKSRLLYELEQWLEDQPLQFSFFKGRCTQEMQYHPYALLKEILMSHWHIQDLELPNEVLWHQVSKKIKSQETNLSENQISCIGQMLGLIPTTNIDKTKGQAEAKTALLQYIQKISETTITTWLVEDIHWADESTLALLANLYQTMAHCTFLLITSNRPDFWQKYSHWGSWTQQHTAIKLSKLSNEHTRQLITEMLQKVDKIPVQLEKLLIEHSHGNPLYMEELLHMLIGDGTIITSPNKWFINPTKLSEIRLPPTLTGILQARLDSLSLPQRNLLQQAAIVGRTFWPEAIIYLRKKLPNHNEADEPSIQQLLQQLMQQELIQREEESVLERKSYSFTNPILREIAYESLLKSDRKAYHGHIAEWLIGDCDEQTPEYFSFVAEHLEKGQKNSEAIVYLRHAGEQAQQTYGFQESIHFFKRALALLAMTEHHEERVRLTREIGRAMINVGQWDNAKTWLQESLDIARQSAIPQQIVTSLQDLSQLAQDLGEYQEAMSRIDEGLAIIKKHKIQLSNESSLYYQKTKDNIAGFVTNATDIASVVARQQAVQAKKKIGEAFSGVVDRIKAKTESNKSSDDNEHKE